MRKWINLIEDFELITPEFEENFLNHLYDYFGILSPEEGGSEENNAEWEYSQWKETFLNLYERGGSIYRVIFAENKESLRLTVKEIGEHWSMRPLHHEDDVVQRLSNNAHYYRDRSEGDLTTFFIRATVPPKSVTFRGVNIPEEWKEYEVNVLSPGAIRDVTIMDVASSVTPDTRRSTDL